MNLDKRLRELERRVTYMTTQYHYLEEKCRLLEERKADRRGRKPKKIKEVEIR